VCERKGRNVKNGARRVSNEVVVADWGKVVGLGGGTGCGEAESQVPVAWALLGVGQRRRRLHWILAGLVRSDASAFRTR
jgi:hypothetical protein